MWLKRFYMHPYTAPMHESSEMLSADGQVSICTLHIIRWICMYYHWFGMLLHTPCNRTCLGSSLRRTNVCVALDDMLCSTVSIVMTCTQQLACDVTCPGPISWLSELAMSAKTSLKCKGSRVTATCNNIVLNRETDDVVTAIVHVCGMYMQRALLTHQLSSL
jgi:hypothetical protein